jgi:hypothetical protein
LLKQVQTG